jgi:quercetin dioxygenase-like cupin family protein
MRNSSLLTGVLLGVLLTLSFGALALQMSRKATVLSFDQAEHRVAPSNKANIRVLAHGAHAFVGHLRMDPGASVPVHRDASEEYIHVLQGAGTITIDGRAHALTPGATVYMPANAKVSYQNGAKEMVAIQIFAGIESAKKYAAWKLVGATP